MVQSIFEHAHPCRCRSKRQWLYCKTLPLPERRLHDRGVRSTKHLSQSRVVFAFVTIDRDDLDKFGTSRCQHFDTRTKWGGHMVFVDTTFSIIIHVFLHFVGNVYVASSWPSWFICSAVVNHTRMTHCTCCLEQCAHCNPNTCFALHLILTQATSIKQT